MEGVVALRRFRALVVHKKGCCWLQVAGGCSLQVQINVKCLGGFPGWLLLADGCSSQVVARAGWTVLPFGLSTAPMEFMVIPIPKSLYQHLEW